FDRFLADFETRTKKSLRPVIPWSSSLGIFRICRYFADASPRALVVFADPVSLRMGCDAALHIASPAPALQGNITASTDRYCSAVACSKGIVRRSSAGSG
ncbi:MAG TPA: hypothetical protein VNR40_12610, partial [Steroidobacter sp.]|nr:hypothetical protein [Steroidobacter sp.]